MKKLTIKVIPSRISTKLSLLVSAIVFVCFAVLQFSNFLILKSEVKNKIHAEQYTSAQFIANDIESKFAKRKHFLNALANVIPLEKVQSDVFLSDTLKKHLAFSDLFPQGFVVFSPDGNRLISEYPILPGRNKLTITHEKWFIDALNSDQVVVSSPFRSIVIDEVLVIIAKAIRDENGQVLAVLEAPLFLNRPGFMGYVFDENYRKNSDILVLSRVDNIFLASSEPSRLLKPTPEIGSNLFHDKVMNGFNGYGDLVNSQGKKIFAAAANINSPDWFVVIRTPASVIYQELNTSLRTAIINGVIASFLGFIAITFFLSLFFTPLTHAVKTIKKMVLPNQSLFHIKDYKNDEIGDLIRGFNLLVDKVNERSDTLKKANAALESLSQTDGLTEIFNRRWFDETLTQRWRVNTRNQQPLTLLMIDIDYFKKFNDTYGHLAGDDCLKRVAQIIQKSMHRPSDFFARYGGEEFVILLNGNIEEGTAIAEKVLLAVSNLNITHTGSHYHHVTVSLGLASIVPQLNSKSDDLVKQADIALYQSKENGRNRYECSARCR